MNYRYAILFACAVWPLAVPAEDVTTLEGKTYTNVVVQRCDRQGIFIQHDGGTNKIPFKEILPELREYYKKQARIPMLEAKTSGGRDGPAGTNDIATRYGPVYRNVVVKRVEEHAVVIAHDGGAAKVYFTDIPDKAVRDRYRTATPSPDAPLGSNDWVAVDGQIFRDVEIRRAEPDGLTFRHAGGVTKLRFPSLSKELRKQYGYDPQAAAKYQRATAAAKKRAEEEEAARRAKQAAAKKASAAAPVSISGVKTDRRKDGQYRIRFSIRNHTGRSQSIRAIPYNQRQAAIMGGKKFEIPPNAKGEALEILVPIIQPKRLTIYCGDYQTNRTLRW
ncbi:MAG: hypothetical protein AB7V14_12260 [Kiritimatiellia bacterium]